MSQFLSQMFRGAVLGMMLLLAAGANLVCISFDTDNDEETPPITIELNLVAPKRSNHLPNKKAQAETIRQKDLQATSPTLVAEFNLGAGPVLEAGSPQQVIPLRN